MSWRNSPACCNKYMMDIIVILDACMSSIMGFDDLMRHILVQFNPHIIHAEKELKIWSSFQCILWAIVYLYICTQGFNFLTMLLSNSKYSRTWRLVSNSTVVLFKAHPLSGKPKSISYVVCSQLLPVMKIQLKGTYRGVSRILGKRERLSRYVQVVYTKMWPNLVKPFQIAHQAKSN